MAFRHKETLCNNNWISLLLILNSGLSFNDGDNYVSGRYLLIVGPLISGQSWRDISVYVTQDNDAFTTSCLFICQFQHRRPSFLLIKIFESIYRGTSSSAHRYKLDINYDRGRKFPDDIFPFSGGIKIKTRHLNASLI